MPVEFEYDTNKSLSNKTKHGIDFDEARLLWDDKHLIVLPAKEKRGEVRYLVVGKIVDRYYSAIITFRGVKVRIISVRRSRENEIERYKRSLDA